MAGMTLMIRDATPADYPEAARLLTASNPEWPVTAALLEQEARQRDPSTFHRELAAETDGRLVGLAAFGHMEHAFDPDKYWLNIQVNPTARGRGVGRALYARITEELNVRGARRVQAMCTEAQAEGRRFLEGRGFEVAWRRHESRLQTAGLDFTPLTALEAALASRGVTLRPLRDVKGEAAWERWLYELDWRLFQDVPLGEAVTKRPFEAWRRELDDPHFSLDASFVALDARRDDSLMGQFVGYSCLLSNPAGFWMIGMTGVLPEYRGLGIAKALKLRGAQFVQAHSGGEIRTFNDPPNTAMLSMNAALGFVRQPDRLRYAKELP